MAKEHPKEEESSGEGAPLWMISFADMMSLLMAFFVMLTTFSSFGPKEEDQLRTAIMVALAPFGDLLGHGVFQSSGDDMSKGPNPTGEATENSEKRTFEQAKGSLKPTSAPDFRTHKVFTADSRNMFWSTGTTLSTHGRQFVDTIGAYAARIHGPIVVGESGSKPDDLGVQRAIAVARYLIDGGVPEDSINVAACALQPAADGEGRKLQVTFLAEDIQK